MINPFEQNLGRRGETFARMANHVLYMAEKRGFDMIIETGTARTEGNWSGDGQSTLIWDWLSETFKSNGQRKLNVLSIDKDKNAIDTASKQTKNVDYMCQDSVEALKSLASTFVGSASLLYLDSFDWCMEKNEESAMHHLRELEAVWRHLSPGCMIAVDDRHSHEQGKHVAVHKFMRERFIPAIFCDYQIGWVKPAV